MRTILIGYDLNQDGQNYPKLIKQLKTFLPWFAHLDSTWIIKTDKTTSQVMAVLSPLIDDNDELMVVEIKGETATWTGFDESADNWLQKYL